MVSIKFQAECCCCCQVRPLETNTPNLRLDRNNNFVYTTYRVDNWKCHYSFCYTIRLHRGKMQSTPVKAPSCDNIFQFFYPQNITSMYLKYSVMYKHHIYRIVHAKYFAVHIKLNRFLYIMTDDTAWYISHDTCY